MLERKDHFFPVTVFRRHSFGYRKWETRKHEQEPLMFSSKLLQFNPWEEVITSMYLPSITIAPERLECCICKQGVALNWYLDKVHCADHKPSRVHLYLGLCSVPAFGKCLIWLQYPSLIPPWFKLCFFSFPFLCWMVQLKQSFAFHAGLRAEWEGCFFP